MIVPAMARPSVPPRQRTKLKILLVFVDGTDDNYPLSK